MPEYTYKYPRPAVTADCVVFGIDGETAKVLLIERGNEPFKGKWALPGGFMEIGETAEECARRELYEETGMDCTELTQLHTFSDVHRDPRERVVSIAFYTITEISDPTNPILVIKKEIISGKIAVTNKRSRNGAVLLYQNIADYLVIS